MLDLEKIFKNEVQEPFYFTQLSVLCIVHKSPLGLNKSYVTRDITELPSEDQVKTLLINTSDSDTHVHELVNVGIECENSS